MVIEENQEDSKAPGRVRRFLMKPVYVHTWEVVLFLVGFVCFIVSAFVASGISGLIGVFVGAAVAAIVIWLFGRRRHKKGVAADTPNARDTNPRWQVWLGRLLILWYFYQFFTIVVF